MQNHPKNRNYVAVVKMINAKHFKEGYLRLYHNNHYYRIPESQFLTDKQAVIIKNTTDDIKNKGYSKYAIGIVMHIKHVDDITAYPDQIKLVTDCHFNDFYSKRNGFNKLMSLSEYPELRHSYISCQRLIGMLR